AAIGSLYERAGDHFTGARQIMRHERKVRALNSLIATFDATTKGSLSIGDSGGDIAMLELAEQPIAFNPDKILFDHAQTRGWKIVIERKNMIYKLEPKDGSYILA
ncbi:MAG: HAD family hydrolase, partial [Candidatus Saccharimonadales bacterium]